MRLQEVCKCYEQQVKLPGVDEPVKTFMVISVTGVLLGWVTKGAELNKHPLYGNLNPSLWFFNRWGSEEVVGAGYKMEGAIKALVKLMVK